MNESRVRQSNRIESNRTELALNLHYMFAVEAFAGGEASIIFRLLVYRRSVDRSVDSS